MTLVTPNQSVPNGDITAASINGPINQLAAAINGNIDDTNVSGISGAKLSSGSVTTAKLADDAVTAAKIDWAATGANAGIWGEEIGRTTLIAAGDSITVSGLPARKYLEIIIRAKPTGGTIDLFMQLNGDTANNYTRRYSINGAAHATPAAGGSILLATSANTEFFFEGSVINVLAEEKVLMGNTVARNAAGTGANPDAFQVWGKWANTTAAISSISILNAGGTGDFAIGSEVIVKGHN